jgi:two-component system sensor histidine kinase UhpB
VRWRRGLFWQVFGLNAGLLILAVVLLATTPATISHPITLSQGLMLAVSAVVALLANALLLHVSLRPLRQLVALMANVDLLQPGQRLKIGGAREFVIVAEAFNDMLDRLERERRSSALRLLASHEAERRHLARELHDEIGQRLTALLLLLRPAVEEAPPQLQESLTESHQLTRGTLDEVRRIARHLRPTVLDDLGLEPGLRALCDLVERTAQTPISQTYDEKIPRLSDEVELALYRTAQEALTNVVRHAHATNVVLDLGVSNGDVRLTISDNGRGLTYRGDEHGGIRSMRERAVAVGGQVAIRSSPGGGTTVTITAPVGPPR